MQATQPNSGTEQATTDSNIKRYKVSQTFGYYEVWLEVDHRILTPARAKEINEFWGGSEDRIRDENGDEVRAVIRLAGIHACEVILVDSLGGTRYDTCADTVRAWSMKFHARDGWGGEIHTPFGWCGIRIVAGFDCPGFDEFEVREVARG